MQVLLLTSKTTLSFPLIVLEEYNLKLLKRDMLFKTLFQAFTNYGIIRGWCGYYI